MDRFEISEDLFPSAMHTSTITKTRQLRRTAAIKRKGREVVAFLAAVGLVAYAAVVVKNLAAMAEAPEALSMIESDDSAFPGAQTTIPAEPVQFAVDPLLATVDEATLAPTPDETMMVEGDDPDAGLPEAAILDTSVRFFNGRAVKPGKTMWMVVTAYSPDERSCAGTADGITASNHHVLTNAHRLVAADTRILPLGSMISIPGYDAGQIVPVLDRGGAIKGNRLDVLFPTHEQARKWGVKRLKVTVWEYADGQGKDNWRKIRDSKR